MRSNFWIAWSRWGQVQMNSKLPWKWRFHGVKIALFWFNLIWIWPQMTKSRRKFSRIYFFRWRPNQLIAVQLQKSADVLSTGISKTNWLCSLYFEIFILNELFERQLWFSGIYDFRSVECRYSLCSGVQLVPGHVFSCKYSKRAEISSPPIWWYHELSWLQL